MAVLTRKPTVINNHQVTSLLKVSCAVQDSISELAMLGLSGSVIDIKQLSQVEGHINRLKHEVCTLKTLA